MTNSSGYGFDMTHLFSSKKYSAWSATVFYSTREERRIVRALHHGAPRGKFLKATAAGQWLSLEGVLVKMKKRLPWERTWGPSSTTPHQLL